jgi:tetratricopeptide (TPR) repeat protein
LSGAIAYVEDRRSDFESEVAAALKINPTFSDAYRVAADQAASNYRFEEAVALERKALTLDPEDVKTHAALGVHLLRTGDEGDGRDHLETAFKADPFDRTTYNLLTMMDSLDKFEVVREGNLIIKLDPKEAPVMRELVGPLAQRALAAYEKKYQFTPTGADSDRDVSQARRFRRAHGGTAGVPGRARRLLRPRGHARFAEGEAAGRLQLGAHVVARAGACHHAAAIQAARAAVADGGHFHLRRETRVTRLGTRRGADICGSLRPRRSHERPRAECRLHEP